MQSQRKLCCVFLACSLWSCHLKGSPHTKENRGEACHHSPSSGLHRFGRVYCSMRYLAPESDFPGQQCRCPVTIKRQGLLNLELKGCSADVKCCQRLCTSACPAEEAIGSGSVLSCTNIFLVLCKSISAISFLRDWSSSFFSSSATSTFSLT